MELIKEGVFEVSKKPLSGRVTWRAVYNTETNKSVVSIEKLEIKSSDWYGFSYYLNGNIHINGKRAIDFAPSSESHTVKIDHLNTYYQVNAKKGKPAPWTTGEQIEHNADGSKEIVIAVGTIAEEGDGKTAITLTNSNANGDHGKSFSGDQTISIGYTRHIVSYNANGFGTAPESQSVFEGDSITLPTLTADGYAFKGWATDPNATSGITGTYTPTATVTLYAVWKKIHTVTYDANGRGTAPAADNVVDGDSITLPTITDKGYNFLGWATSPDAKEGINGEYAPTASVTLYAVWRQKGSIVGYNDGGTCVKCRVRVRINGNVYPCRVYYRSNGTAVEV